jgi:hypothetical protein
VVEYHSSIECELAHTWVIFLRPTSFPLRERIGPPGTERQIYVGIGKISQDGTDFGAVSNTRDFTPLLQP